MRLTTCVGYHDILHKYSIKLLNKNKGKAAHLLIKDNLLESEYNRVFLAPLLFRFWNPRESLKLRCSEINTMAEPDSALNKKYPPLFPPSLVSAPNLKGETSTKTTEFSGPIGRHWPPGIVRDHHEEEAPSAQTTSIYFLSLCLGAPPYVTTLMKKWKKSY